jgi:transcriptional regulator with XRE-family HTH domain
MKSAVPLNGRLTLNSSLLKQLRQGRHLSQEEMADLCAEQQLQISLSSIKRAETGSPVRYRIARELAHFFQVSVQALLADAEQTAQTAPAAAHDAHYQQALALLEQVLNLSLPPPAQQQLTQLKDQLQAKLKHD